MRPITTIILFLSAIASWATGIQDSSTIVYKSGVRSKVYYVDSTYLFSDLDVFPIINNNVQSNIPKADVEYLIFNERCIRFQGNSTIQIPYASIYESGKHEGIYYTYPEFRSNLVDTSFDLEVEKPDLEKRDGKVANYYILKISKDGAKVHREHIGEFFAYRKDNRLFPGRYGPVSELHLHALTPWYMKAVLYPSGDSFPGGIPGSYGGGVSVGFSVGVGYTGPSNKIRDDDVYIVTEDGESKKLAKSDFKRMLKPYSEVYAKYKREKKSPINSFQTFLLMTDPQYIPADIYGGEETKK